MSLAGKGRGITMAVQHCAVPATDNGRGTQLPYIRDLMQQRSVPDEPREGHADDSLMLERMMDVFGGKFICKHEASEFLDWLLKLNMKDGSPPPPPPNARPRSGRYPARSSRWSGMGQVPASQPAAGRSDRVIAVEAISLARQLAAQPGVRQRMQLVDQIHALEKELLK